MIISFAHTTGALLSGQKTVTRRDWADRHVTHFHEGDLVQAWDKLPRAHGQHVANIRLTTAPQREPLLVMPDSDYEAEGFGWLYAFYKDLPREIWGTRITNRRQLSREWFERWRRVDCALWVVRFELIRDELWDRSRVDFLANRGVGQ